jgi:hypothetical protein
LLKLSGSVSPSGWTPPADMSEADWRSVGAALDKLSRGLGWLIGDWWIYGESRYGGRKAITEAGDWEGPAFKTCANAATVCRAFETSRRREVLSFKHHAEVASLQKEKADALLDWCEETTPPRSTRELREKSRGQHINAFERRDAYAAPRILNVPVEDTAAAPYTINAPAKEATRDAPRTPEVKQGGHPIEPDPPVRRETGHIVTMHLVPDEYARLRRHADTKGLSVEEAAERLLNDALNRLDALAGLPNAESGGPYIH